jgi:putative Mn2+ efflux pump MntP
MSAFLALILPLSLDTFAISAALGVGGLPRHRRLRTAALLTAFEAGMPLIGLAIGAPLGRVIGPIADYIAIALLLALGAHTVLADEGEEEHMSRIRGASGWGIVALGLSVSLDELAVGFTLGLLRLPIVPVLCLIAAQAFIASQLGLRLGARLGEGVRERAERLAGVALIALGLALVAETVLG